MALGALGLWDGLTHSPLVMAYRKQVLEHAQEDQRHLIMFFFSGDAQIAQFLRGQIHMAAELLSPVSLPRTPHVNHHELARQAV